MLDVKKLHIQSSSKKLVEISFKIKSSLALVGQSGSGKTLTLKALLGMLPHNLHLLLEHSGEFELNKKTVAFVPQNPFTALSPLTKIKDQFRVSKERSRELFKLVDLSCELLESYPPELSGGQLQRAVVAMELEYQPKLLLLDEPTTALDPATTDTVLNLLARLQKQQEFLMLFVTHDILSAAKLCEDVCVIKEGLVVEYGTIHSVLKDPKEQYTKTLIEANFAQRNFRQ